MNRAERRRTAKCKHHKAVAHVDIANGNDKAVIYCPDCGTQVTKPVWKNRSQR